MVLSPYILSLMPIEHTKCFHEQTIDCTKREELDRIAELEYHHEPKYCDWEAYRVKAQLPLHTCRPDRERDEEFGSGSSMCLPSFCQNMDSISSSSCLSAASSASSTSSHAS